MLNWIIGPALMFALAWLLLPDLPEYRTGLIIVGLARCIAMVIIWNDLACGDREAAAVLVALNSIFQVIMFAVLGWFYLVGAARLARPATDHHHAPRRGRSPSPCSSSSASRCSPDTSPAASARRPRAATGTSRSSCPRIGPWALYGLLFTIVILFALQGDQITCRPLDVARIALPLLAYFAIMWGGGYLLGAAIGLGYQRTTTLAFTAAGNNFELAIAVAIATYGVTSGQALAGVVGPLIEVPVLVAWSTSPWPCDGDSPRPAPDPLARGRHDQACRAVPLHPQRRSLADGDWDSSDTSQATAPASTPAGPNPPARSTPPPSPPWPKRASTSRPSNPKQWTTDMLQVVRRRDHHGMR